MHTKPTDIGDIFAEEEARARAEHQRWLADPAAQAKYAAEVSERAARAIDLSEIDDAGEPEDDEDDDDEEEAEAV